MWTRWSNRNNELPQVDLAEEENSDSSEPAGQRSPPPGTPAEESGNFGLDQLRAHTDRVTSEQVINQLANRLNASFGDQVPDAGQAQGQAMTNYDEQSGQDGASALEKACNSLKGYEFDEQDLSFYFNQVELQMRQNGVKKNYTKFLVLTSILPIKVRDQVKPLLRKQETEYSDANQQPYKVLKDKILKIYEPPQESRFERAMSRVLSSKPSELARTLVSDLCDHELVGCCCGHIIVGFWKRQLPLSVRQAIASERFNADTFDQVVKHADDVMVQSKTGLMVPGLSAMSVSGAVSLPAPDAFDEAFSEEWSSQQLAAFGYTTRGGRGGRGGRSRGQRGGRGGGRGSGNSGQNFGGQRSNGQGNQGQGQGQNSHPKHKTQRHPDQPPFKACFRHWTFGKSAHFCMEPGTCPWKDFFVPKPNQ